MSLIHTLASLLLDPNDSLVDILGKVADFSPFSRGSGDTRGHVSNRNYRLTSLFSAAVVGVRPWENHFPELYVLTKKRVNTLTHICAVARNGSLPLMDPPTERVSIGARSLRMWNVDGTGALPEKGLSPDCEGRIRHGLGHEEDNLDPLVARSASCGTQARDVPEPCPGTCVTASFQAELDHRPGA